MKKKIVAVVAIVCLSACSSLNTKKPFMCCVNTVNNTLTCSQELIPWDVISQPGTFCNVSNDMASSQAAAVAASKVGTSAK